MKKFFLINNFVFKKKNLKLILTEITEITEENLKNKIKKNNNIIYKNNSEFFNNFEGIKIDKKEYSEKQTIFVWNLFLVLDELFFFYIKTICIKN